MQIDTSRVKKLTEKKKRTTSQGALVFLLWKQRPQLKQLPFETSGAKGAQTSVHLKHF
jgi:hypothetical protein